MLRLFMTPRGVKTIIDWLLPIALLLALLCLGVGLYYALWQSPADYQQGDSVRIMYIHVPAAYISVSGYALLAVSSAIYLIWKLPMMQIVAEAVAPIGMVFTFVCLMSGALWGKPIWGTWWVWDARLTSVLVLFFLYLGFIALQDAFPQRNQGYKPAAILAVLGAINLPIIKFSVDWWNTLHQPASIFRTDGIAIAPEMLTPLLWMMGAFLALFASMSAIRVDTLLRQRKL